MKNFIYLFFAIVLFAVRGGGCNTIVGGSTVSPHGVRSEVAARSDARLVARRHCVVSFSIAGLATQQIGGRQATI